MRTPDEVDPYSEYDVPVELRDLLVHEAVWAIPPPDLLDDLLAAIEASQP
jgi:hypothetical protein